MLDIHTIGAGGGSIAQVDLGGALRVGPQSASADPGPACYGRIDPAVHPDKAFPTVTDANLVLGRLLPDQFLGGEMPLRVDFAWQVFERLGKQLGLQKPLRSQRPKEKTAAIRAALGVIAVVNANMERALRVISVERGHDPRRFSLLSYGGAGGLHAAELARHLGIPRLLISPYASTLSALGMLAADVAKDYTQTVMLPGDTSASQLHEKLTLLLEQGQRDLEAEGLKVEDLQFQTSLDMRYQGQSYELTIPWKPDSDWLETFHRTHHQTYGYARPEAAVEIVNLRLRAVGLTRRACSQPPGLPRFPQGAGSPEQALLRRSPVVLNNAETHSLPVYRWEKLPPGSQILGPALILRPDTTLFLGIGDQAQVDSFQNLRVVIAPARKKES